MSNRKSAMLEYLKVAQQLEGFGISKFDIKVKKEKRLTLGVSTVGMSVQTMDGG